MTEACSLLREADGQLLSSGSYFLPRDATL